jgi:hypothetical protein
VTATIGWAAAAATARLRYGGSVSALADPVVLTADPGTAPTTPPPPVEAPAPEATQPQSSPAQEDGEGMPGAITARPTRRKRARYILLLSPRWQLRRSSSYSPC